MDEGKLRKAMALKNTFRTVKTPRGPDPAILKNSYESIKSMERGEEVPQTRNVFRRSTVEGEEQAPVAVARRKEWLLKYGPAPDPRAVVYELFRNTNKVITYMAFGSEHYLVWTDIRAKIRLRSMCYEDKTELIAAYRGGTVRYIESEAISDSKTTPG